MIEVRRWAVLDPDEQREIELAENLNRKNLTTLERSRNVVQLADVAAEVDRTSFVRTPDERSQNATKPGSLRRVSERTGLPRQTIHDARQHVAAVEQYPTLSHLPQSVALAAAKALDALRAARTRVLRCNGSECLAWVSRASWAILGTQKRRTRRPAAE